MMAVLVMWDTTITSSHAKALFSFSDLENVAALWNHLSVNGFL